MVQVRTIAFAWLLVACGSSSDPNAANNGGGSNAGNANNGGAGGGLNVGGAGNAGAAAGSGGGASGSAGASPSGGAAGGTALHIAPFAKHIACGATSNDVVLSDGRLYTWGGGTSKGTFDPRNNYAQISAGSTDKCFVLTDSTVSCADTSSSLGKSPPAGAFTELHVAQGYTSVHAACAKSAAGTLTCWGDTTNTVVSQAPTSTVSSFAVNSSNGCAVGSGGAVQCWGTNLPTATTHTDFANVYTGLLFSCGVTASGDMTCWTFTTAPTTNVAQLAIGSQFACAIESNGHAFCFDNQPNDPSVVQPPAGSSFVEVTVGDSGQGTERACGILVDGSVVCWGSAGDTFVRPPPDPIKAF